MGDLRPDRGLGFYGKILDVRIWEVIRTQEEIQYGMNNDLIGNETGLIGYWPFNEGSGTVANDIQTNGTQHDGLFGATHSAPIGENPTWTTGFSTTVEMGSPNPSVPETIVTQSNMIKLPLTHFTLTTTATVAPLLNSVTFSTSGTYLATEVANFKLWYNTTNDLSTASQIGSTITSSLGTGIHSFNGLTQALSAGTTAYLWITTDIQQPVTPGGYINASLIAASDFNTSSGFKTGYTSAGGIQIFDSTLPVELSSFTATTTAQYFVQLHWVTQSETDVLGYMVLRSDVNDLEHAHQVSPLITATNTSAQANYSYTDTEVSPGTWYYWLQSIDLGGSFVFHGPVLATVTNGQDSGTPDIPNSNGISKIYPNPFNPNATIVYGLKEASPVTISIFNAKGQLIQKHDLSTEEAGMHNFRWDADGLPAGTYLIRMQAGNEYYNSKAVISK